MKRPIALLAFLFFIFIMASVPAATLAQGPTGTPSTSSTAAPTTAAAPSVKIAYPKDGDTVTNPVTVIASYSGITLVPSSTPATSGQGHLHVIIDGSAPPAGQTVPRDSTHLHLANGASTTTLGNLTPGKHTLTLVFGNSSHVVTSPVLTDTVNVTVAGAPSPYLEITLQGGLASNDDSFLGPDQINAGWVGVTFVNTGKQPHQANLARIKDGKTMDDLTAALKQSPAAALALVDFYGGPNTVDPGGMQRVVVNLPEGNYVWLCFVPDASDGQPHLAHGMIRPMKVVAASPQATASEPKADATVVMQDFAYITPSTIKPGVQSWKITNNGPQTHELTLLQLASGKTADDVKAFFAKPSGMPPFVDLGGVSALAPGKSSYLNLNLQPGTYVIECNVPDIKTGTAHVDLGMITTFVVGATSAAGTPTP